MRLMEKSNRDAVSQPTSTSCGLGVCSPGGAGFVLQPGRSCVADILAEQADGWVDELQLLPIKAFCDSAHTQIARYSQALELVVFKSVLSRTMRRHDSAELHEAFGANAKEKRRIVS